MLVADENGRYPLSMREYDALKNLFGSYNALCCGVESLAERAKTKKYVWRDLKMLQVRTDQVLAQVLDTIPKDKLGQISHELKRTHVYLKTEGATSVEPDNYIYVRGKDLYDLVEMVNGFACAGCSKNGKKAKKCPVFKAMTQVYPYEFTLKNNAVCPFSDLCEVEEINKEVEDHDT